MTVIEALISGIVQGLTEFLPISSSGHLVLVHRFFGFSEPTMFFDICLHAATLCAVIIYFQKDILDLVMPENRKWLLYIGVGTIPAVIVALLFEDGIDKLFARPQIVSVMLMVTGAVLLAAHISLRFPGKKDREMNLGSSILVGIGQAFALIPGISRSGMTISSGLMAGIKAETAFKFSFLLSIPVIIMAVGYKSLKTDVSAILHKDILIYMVGMAAAFVVGLISLHLLWKVIQKKKLYIFGIYCIVAGILTLFL